jgi:hypothetical protein
MVQANQPRQGKGRPTTYKAKTHWTLRATLFNLGLDGEGRGGIIIISPSYNLLLTA